MEIRVTSVRPDSSPGFWLSVGIVVWAATLASGGSSELDEAQSQFALRHYREAVTTLQTGLTRAPSNGQLHYWLARCFYELRDYGQAVAHAEAAVQYDSGNSDYHLWLGRAYGGKAEQAHSFVLARRTKSEFEAAVRLDPANIPARRDLAEFHLEAPWIVGGHKDEALRQIEAIAALDPVGGHLARANYWLHEKKPERAEAEYQQILKLNPQRTAPYFEVADSYANRQDIAPMQEAVEAAARVDPTDSQLPCYRGRLFIMAGNRLDEAENLLKRCLASPRRAGDSSTDVVALVWLGRLYERLGKRLEAAARYRTALQLDPDCRAAREALQQIDKEH